MSAPAKLVAAALALWGWSIGYLALGILLGLGYELARAAGLAPKLAARTRVIARACAGASLILLVFVLATQSLPTSLYTWLRWLPVLLLPLALLGRYRDADTTHAYAAIALAAAGTGTGALPWLYPACAAIVGWALLARLPRARLASAAVMLVAAAAFGHAIHTGIWLLQGRVEEWSTELLLDFFAGKADPFRERTRIGDLGRIKLSDRILMRVHVDSPRPGSLLLRESSFEAYRTGEWRNARPTPRVPPREGDRWVLRDGPSTSRLTLRRSIPGGEGLLPLPMGTRAIERLAAESVEIYPSGAVRVRGAPRFVAFSVTYDPEGERALPDPRADLEVPANLVQALERTADAHALRQPDAARTVAAVRAFFDRHFAYSLDLGQHTRTIADFLLHDRKGHCEYFATATVMLLRSLGVPARYAAGYSAQEYSALERAFVVRNRHAHAWVQAFVDGRWIEVDTTPARWADFEAEEARGFFAPVMDAFSWALGRLVQAWLALSGGSWEERLRWGVAALLALAVGVSLAWRVRKLRLGGRVRLDAIGRAWSAVERRVARAGHPRESTETVREWVRRIPESIELGGLAADYYRVRFDPASGTEEARRFVEAARHWAPAHRRSSGGRGDER